MPRPIILSTHLYFALAGKTIDGDTVSETYKPDIDPAENWTQFGEIKSMKVNHAEKEHEFWGNNLGNRELVDVLISKQDLKLSFMTEDIRSMIFEMLFGTLEIDTAGTGAYVPTSRRSQIKGWWKFMQYDTQDQLVNTIDIWGLIKIASGEIEFDDQESLVSTELEVRKLRSALNSGQLQNI